MSTQAQNQNWFKHSEAAAYCRISPRTLRRWRAAGRIRHYDGKYFRDDLDRAVRNEDLPPRAGLLKPDHSQATPLQRQDKDIIPAEIRRLMKERPIFGMPRAGKEYLTQGLAEDIQLPVPTPEEITQMDAYADGAAERNGDQLPALGRSPESPCPTCGAVYRSVRRHAMPSGQLMTGIGCTDNWHPRAEEKDGIQGTGQ